MDGSRQQCRLQENIHGTIFIVYYLYDAGYPEQAH